MGVGEKEHNCVKNFAGFASRLAVSSIVLMETE